MTPPQTDEPFRRLPLALLPSPLHDAPRLAEAIGAPGLFLKRDDLLGRVLGGNKLRKLEYILPEAVADGADTLVTTGSFESNHVCLTVAAGAMLGLRSAVVVMGPTDHPRPTLNESLEQSFGAEIRCVSYAPDDDEARRRLSADVDACVDELRGDLERSGRRSWFVPPGGCCPQGGYAYAAAFDELHDQMLARGVDAYELVLPVGTGSTFAGLWCGIRRRGADVRLLGISIARRNPRCQAKTAEAAAALCEVLSLTPPAAEELSIADAFIGDGYGQATDPGREAIRIARKTEGLLLDNTYTGKALGGLASRAAAGELSDRPVVFWHTGGVAGAVEGLLGG